MKRMTKRFAAAVGVFAIAALSTTAFAGAASAAPANVPTTPASLTIHKFEQPSPAGSANDNGTPITVPGGWVALAGVNFTIAPITDVDLTTTQGWDLAKSYSTNPALATQLGTATTVTTGGTGVVATTGLPVGAYLVTETASPGATRVDTGAAANITMMAAPFVVTLPVPTGDGTWNSDVHVYPKNSLTAVEKTSGTPVLNGVGAVMPWTITVKIPTLAPGQHFTSFDIVDALDAKLAYVAGSATATAGSAPVALTDTSAGQTVNLAVTDLVALEALQGQTLSVTFSTTVLAAGEIVNEADVFINNPGHDSGIGSNPASTYWGQIQINKHAAGDPSATLAGAVFSVFASEADAIANQNPINVGGETTFTTQANGSLVIPGLFVSNTAGATRDFFLREIAAPAGYQLVETPITVTLTANGTVATPVQIAVPNPQVQTFTLPLTGAAGTIVMTVAGAALLAGGTFLAMIAGRRRKAAQI